MFYQYMLKPEELNHVIDYAQECLFIIKAKLPKRNYQVAVYKYDEEYFVLNDPCIFRQLQDLNEMIQGDEEKILPYVEESFNENLYCRVEEKYVKLDLYTLATLAKTTTVQIKYYEFIDFQ